MSLEEPVARIEGILEQMDKRLARLENDVAHLREEVLHLREEVSRRIEEVNMRVDSLSRWMVGLIFGMWASIMLTLIPILLRLLGAI